jgi:hypothetical protein
MKDAKTIVPTSWPKVFSGPCGKLAALFFFLSLVLFVVMITYVGIYVNLLLNHPSTVCVTYPFAFLSIAMPIVLVLWFLTTLYIIRFCHDTRATSKRHRIMCCFIIFLGYVGLFLGLQLYAPLYSMEGLIIKVDNDNDTMFQFLRDYEGNSAGYLNAYPIFFKPDGIDNMFPNLTCDFVLFYDLCPVFGPLRSTDLPGALRCRPNAECCPGPFVSYLEPLSGLGCTAASLCAVFTMFFQFGYFLLVERRLSSPKTWIENQFCPSRFRVLGEGTPLI